MPTVQTTIVISIQLMAQLGIPTRSNRLDWPRIKCESSHNMDIVNPTLQSMGAPDTGDSYPGAMSNSS